MTANKHTPMVVAAARALCRRDSDICNVDFDDNWKFYGDGFLMDAQVALESAAAPELLEAAMAFIAPFDGIEVVQGGDIAKARAAIAKATGSAA